MNRIDRLTALLLLLKDRGRSRLCTSEELAAHFEVSRRTILRDILALCEMGVPVISQDGSGGGYRLPHDFGVTPLPLTANESMLMLLSLSAIERMSDSPFAAERETLRAKLRTLIAHRHIPDVESRLNSLSVDVPTRSARAPHLEAMLEAARSGDWLRIDYRSAERTSTQTIQPRRLYAAGGFWYVQALSLERREERTYRADRVLAVRRIPPPPESADLPAPKPYQHESHPEVHIRLSAQGVERVESERHLGQAIERLPDGRGELRFRCPPSELRWLAEFVLGLGRLATVVSPDELRFAVRDLALDVAAKYPKDSAGAAKR